MEKISPLSRQPYPRASSAQAVVRMSAPLATVFPEAPEGPEYPSPRTFSSLPDRRPLHGPVRLSFLFSSCLAKLVIDLRNSSCSSLQEKSKSRSLFRFLLGLLFGNLGQTAHHRTMRPIVHNKNRTMACFYLLPHPRHGTARRSFSLFFSDSLLNVIAALAVKKIKLSFRQFGVRSQLSSSACEAGCSFFSPPLDHDPTDEGLSRNKPRSAWTFSDLFFSHSPALEVNVVSTKKTNNFARKPQLSSVRKAPPWKI